MYSRTIRCFILSILFFPAIAFAAYFCNVKDVNVCRSASFDSCPDGTPVPSCSTSNVAGTCTNTVGSDFFVSSTYYLGGSITVANAADFGPPCLSAGGTWSAGNAGITPSTPLPPPPTTQTGFTAQSGKMPTDAVSVILSGTFGNATLAVILDLLKALSGGSFAAQGQFAAGYNIYVVALLPKGVLGLPAATMFVLPASGAWAPLGSPMAAYREGLAQNATDKVVISILSGLDVTGLVGTEIYVGYGTSDTEMLAASRYRGVYKM